MRNWEAGKVRIPYAAFKLMRVLRGGKVLGAGWEGFRVRDRTLCTPEGHEFHAGDLAWWSLLVRQAREFRRLMVDRRVAGREAERAPASDNDRLAPLGLSLLGYGRDT